VKLGIAVVYLVDDDRGRLLDIHLQRIARHTSVPYAIYGSAGRLSPQFQPVLRAAPHVTVCDGIPPTELRSGSEHRYYLERLVERAIEDGATHVVTMHVDSFPVRDGWAEHLAAKLTSATAFATFEQINTACLFFTREFWLEHRPRFAVSPEVRETAAYREMLSRPELIDHSGIGYVWTAERAGLGWYRMRSVRARGSCVGDGAVFHLDGAVRLAPAASRPMHPLLRAVGLERFLALVRAVRSMVPAAMRRRLRPLLQDAIDRTNQQPDRFRAAAMAANAAALLGDPDGFIETVGGMR
jgi:hypothetical protein